MTSARKDRHWRLYLRALAILDGEANGHALPIMRALTNRHFVPAVLVLADYESRQRSLALHHRAAATGDAAAMYNLAIEYRNRGDLREYRRHLGFASRVDDEARSEMKAFRRRFPHTIMKQFGMFAPERGR
jgi:hypothetical protein